MHEHMRCAGHFLQRPDAKFRKDLLSRRGANGTRVGLCGSVGAVASEAGCCGMRTALERCPPEGKPDVPVPGESVGPGSEALAHPGAVRRP